MKCNPVGLEKPGFPLIQKNPVVSIGIHWYESTKRWCKIYAKNKIVNGFSGSSFQEGNSKVLRMSGLPGCENKGLQSSLIVSAYKCLRASKQVLSSIPSHLRVSLFTERSLNAALSTKKEEWAAVFSVRDSAEERSIPYFGEVSSLWQVMCLFRNDGNSGIRGEMWKGRV